MRIVVWRVKGPGGCRPGGAKLTGLLIAEKITLTKDTIDPHPFWEWKGSKRVLDIVDEWIRCAIIDDSLDQRLAVTNDRHRGLVMMTK